MFNLTLYSIPPFLTALASLSLGSLVLIKKKNEPTSFAFFLWTIFLFIWLFCYSINYSYNNYHYNQIIGRIGASSVFFLAPAFYHTTIRFLNLKGANFKLSTLYSIVILQTPFYYSTNLFVNQVNKYYFGYYPQAGPLYFLSVSLLVLVLIRIFFIMLNEFKNKDYNEAHKTRLKYFMLGFTISYIAVIDFLPKFNIIFYPFGSFFMLCWALIMFYAIIKHQLLDFRLAIQKGVVYSLLLSVMFIFYISIIIFSEKYLQIQFGYESKYISILTAIILGVTILPLRNRIQKIVEKYVFKNSVDNIVHENEMLRKEVVEAEKYKTLSTLTSGMAHEIKNPLTALKTFSEYLPEKLEDKEFLKKFANITGREVDRINDLVHQLLDYAKPAKPKFEESNIAHLIQETLDTLNNQFVHHHIEVKTQLNTTKQINLDRNQIKQALLNIFLNTIDAMPHGGTLEIDSNTINNQTIIKISDTGPGVNKEDLPHLFDPFFTKKDNGTGLGLSIVKGIMENHKGTITASSEKGTTFTLTLGSTA